MPVVKENQLHVHVYTTHIVCHFRERLSGAGPEHLPPAGRLHVPDRYLVVPADGRDEGGLLRRVGTQTVDVVNVGCGVCVGGGGGEEIRQRVHVYVYLHIEC